MGNTPIRILPVLIAASLLPAISPAQTSASQDALQEIVVTGVRASEALSVELKRKADGISDSIAAEDIGKLPDATISDSLQRITGVQIDREAGEGTSVNIRGLPQVGTLLNGELFLTTTSIVSEQPDFGDIPSQLFSGADVTKSAFASQLNGGITGTINLRTRRPFDLKQGWTASAAAEALRGTQTKKTDPEINGLLGYHGQAWGIVLSASYSDVTRQNSIDGIDQYGGELLGETTDSTTAAEGFLNSWLGVPIPSGIRLLHPGSCINDGGTFSPIPANSTTGCDIDVNGDGKADASFFNSPNFYALDRKLERKRLGTTFSIQGDLGHGLTLTADAFITNENRFDRSTGYQINAATWNGATFLPLQTRNTGVQIHNGFNQSDSDTPLNTFYTTQKYLEYMGDFETYAENQADKSRSRNFNLQLRYDNGGNFTAAVRGIYGKAAQVHMSEYVQFAVSDGSLWPNDPLDAAPPGTFVYPGGNRVFDPLGFAPNVHAATIDMTGDHLGITMPSDITALLANRDAYSLKTMASENNFDRRASLGGLRFDGHYSFGDSGFRLDFGLRHSTRSASNTAFALIAPVYGGLGAYHNVVDPVTGEETDVRVADPAGCYVRYLAADVVLDGAGIPGACRAGDPVTGFYRAGALSAQNSSQLPGVLGNNFGLYRQLAKVSGVSVYDLNPKVMDNVFAFQNELYPGQVRDVDPGGTWSVRVKQISSYVQGNYAGDIGIPFSANFGARIIRTQLQVDQHLAGPTGPYFVTPVDLGIKRTNRSFTDVLPAINLAFDLTQKFKLRLAYAKNMQLLDLDQWGGGLTLEYGLVAGTSPPIFAVLSGNQNGNPGLDPWRSSNYDLSLEYYLSHSSLINLALFYVKVDSFIANGTELRCDLPDQDGVVRNHCVAISGPVQGQGKSLRGLELGLKQSFDFLPGFWGSFGADANFTYSPSNVGRDVAGNVIPFQDNSREQENLVLWYQSKRFEARVAGNYRSKRAVSQDFGGIAGFEEYQAPTFYLDASLSFDITPQLQVYAQGSNLTNERERYYLVWPDQKLHTTQFEPRYLLGVRGRL
ncbi:MAG: TonB-dependent receptor [Proteobacteria bacterium]|nr:TonB-dependent receptor [Pseudomonadota bacterium]